MDQYKTCTKCGQTKPVTEFHRDKQKKDGLTSACKICNIEKSRAYIKLYPEENRRRAASWYRDNWEQARETRRKWAKKNNAWMVSYASVYRQNNKEKSKSYLQNYYLQNIERFIAYSYNRRSRLKSNFVVRKKELICLLKQPCFYCGAPSKHIDHIVPLSRGGRHSIGNLTGSCAPCNLSKGAKFITEWKRGKNAN